MIFDRDALRAKYPELDGAMRRHEFLLSIVKELPEDYEPFGQGGECWQGDCAMDCKWQLEIDSDWGVCTNPASHRCGLLTFEHQGCRHFEMSDDVREMFGLMEQAAQEDADVIQRLRDGVSVVLDAR